MMRRMAIWLGALAVLIVAGLTIYFNHYAISDWWYLRSYTPSAQVAQLAQRAGMTDHGRTLFYRANPQIVTGRADMVRYCHIASAKIAELGCYLSSDQIYLLQINEPALQDEMVTTAGYEMLHSAYQRMSTGRRQHIDARMEQVAANITDRHILDQLQIYAQTEPGARDDELYSVLGTEYPNLPPDLESEYSQYFTNRSQLVGYYQRFNQAFDELHQSIDQLGSQIEAQKSQMRRYLAADQIDAYNSLVPSVNQKIDTYNADVTLYNRYGQDILGSQSDASPQ